MALATTTEIVIGKDTRYNVVLRVNATEGKGFECFIYGGDRPHVGAVALVSRKGEKQYMKLDKVATDLDEFAAPTVADMINDSFREAVSCTSGIEFKDATEKDMDQMKMNIRAAVRHFMGTYER